jgi:hypothetical protein
LFSKTISKGGTEMTHATDDRAISMALEQIIENGFEGRDTAVSISINEAMPIERSWVLEAGPWQRKETRITPSNNSHTSSGLMAKQAHQFFFKA